VEPKGGKLAWGQRLFITYTLFGATADEFGNKAYTVKARAVLDGRPVTFAKGALDLADYSVPQPGTNVVHLDLPLVLAAPFAGTVSVKLSIAASWLGEGAGDDASSLASGASRASLASRLSGWGRFRVSKSDFLAEQDLSGFGAGSGAATPTSSVLDAPSPPVSGRAEEEEVSSAVDGASRASVAPSASTVEPPSEPRHLARPLPRSPPPPLPPPPPRPAVAESESSASEPMENMPPMLPPLPPPPPPLPPRPALQRGAWAAQLVASSSRSGESGLSADRRFPGAAPADATFASSRLDEGDEEAISSSDGEEEVTQGACPYDPANFLLRADIPAARSSGYEQRRDAFLDRNNISVAQRAANIAAIVPLRGLSRRFGLASAFAAKDAAAAAAAGVHRSEGAATPLTRKKQPAVLQVRAGAHFDVSTWLADLNLPAAAEVAAAERLAVDNADRLELSARRRAALAAVPRAGPPSPPPSGDSACTLQ